jgi:hypothetical protein
VPGSIGTLTTGAVSLANAAKFSIQLKSNTITADCLSSTSTVSLGTVAYANLFVSDIGSSPIPLGRNFPIITASSGVSGLFAGLTEGSQFTVGQNIYAISYATPKEVLLTVVPEPSMAMGVLLLGAGRLLQRRRRV